MEEDKSKKKKKSWVGAIIAFLLCIGLILFVLFGLYGFPKKASDFTEEEHLRRVETRISKKYKNWTYDDGSQYTGFSVYPLYNEKDELEYCLVEFEPYEFVFIRIRDEPPKYIQCTALNASMYMMSRTFRKWSPYTIDETNSQPSSDGDKCWILGEKGEKIEYRKSPYYVTQNINERKYLLYSKSVGYVCAVKRGEKFVNLVGGNEIDIEKGDMQKKQSILEIGFSVKTGAL